MTFLTVFPKFNKKNYLEILIKNNFRTKIKISKVCFSLIYSIKSVEGARIHKQLGRYYELKLNKPILSANKNSLILIEMQSTKLGTYNMSCGPEGMFIVDMQDKIIKIFVKKLIFKNKISFPDYKKINNLVKIPIIPQPKKFEINNQFLKFNNNFFTKDNKVLEIVSILNPIIKTIKVNFKSQKGIKIFYEERKFNKEEYIVEISKNYIKIIASNHGGRVYALISLLQLIHYYKNKLPLGIIKDKPQFKWRGMHLDCARQFHSVKKIKRLFEYMVLFKLNRFHWHLTDNEAWRLDLKSFPKLVKKFSYRGYNEIIPPVYGSGYYKYGGYYSTREVKEIIQYAKKLNIEVMPEIELPAHSWAVIQFMPKLLDNFKKLNFQDIGNYKNNTINPCLQTTWKFLKKVINDITKIFPFAIIHIGVDERPKGAWEDSAKIINFMKKNNLKKFSAVQDYFVNRVNSIIRKKNKRTATWNEAVLPVYDDDINIGGTGDIDKNCLIFSWQNPSIAQQVLKKGFQTVICQAQTCYFDMAYNNSTEERGLCWADTIETKDIHAWQPLCNISKKYHSSVAGIQGHLWSETLTSSKYFDAMINPRLVALSEVAWSSKNRRNWKDFKSVLYQIIKITKKLGWDNHKF